MIGKEDDMKSMMDDTLSTFEDQKMIERVEYIMDFGKVYIQYDFCLN